MVAAALTCLLREGQVCIFKGGWRAPPEEAGGTQQCPGPAPGRRAGRASRPLGPVCLAHWGRSLPSSALFLALSTGVQTCQLF